MALLRSKPSDPASPDEPEAAFLRTLEAEGWRAARYERPLSLVVAAPVLLAGERLGRAAARDAAEIAQSCLRRSDRVVVLRGYILAAILPETTADAARVTTFRMCSELSRRPLAGGGPATWRGAAETLREGQDSRALLAAALAAALKPIAA